MLSNKESMNSEDIYRILTSDPYAGRIFTNVFPRDVFVDFLYAPPPRTNYISVFNTQDKSKPGEHWIAFAKNEENGYYFDSYGRHPSTYPDVSRAMRCRFNQVIWNNLQLQGLTTTACGDYCILFALLMSRGWSFERVVQTFTRYKTTEQRDHSVRNTLIHLYGKEGISSLRNERGGLIGKDNLHVKSAVDVIRLFASD